MKAMNLGVGFFVLMLCATAVADRVYVAPDAVDWKSILTTAPSNDSEQTKREIQQILDLQGKRTPEEVTRAKSEESISVFAFSGVMGEWFNPDDLPVTAALMKEVGKEVKNVGTAAKEFYGRQRPPLVDPRIKPCVAMEKSNSYPSGHSARATTWAIILGEMFPDKKDALIARANQIGEDRVLGGMHFQSDIESGRILGQAIAKKFLADADFKASMEKAKDEMMADAKRK